MLLSWLQTIHICYTLIIFKDIFIPQALTLFVWFSCCICDSNTTSFLVLYDIEINRQNTKKKCNKLVQTVFIWIFNHRSDYSETDCISLSYQNYKYTNQSILLYSVNLTADWMKIIRWNLFCLFNVYVLLSFNLCLLNWLHDSWNKGYDNL